MRLFLVILATYAISSPLDAHAFQDQRASHCAVPADSLRSVLRASNRLHRGVGQQTAIVLRGELVFSDDWGLANLEHESPVTAESRFFIASVTKAFTGVALLRLWEDGKVDLDAPIQRYLPDFPPPASGSVTPRLLAAHLGGIRHYGESERDAGFFARHYDDVRDALALFEEDPYASPPGTEFRYSSYGYDLLAAVIQSASGMPFQEYVRREVLLPLELDRTAFDDVRLVVPHRAQGYTFWYPWFTFTQHDTLLRAPDFDYSYNAGGGNMLSTAVELARFGSAVARAGFLSDRSLELTQAPVAADSIASPWSIGWRVETTPAGRLHLRSEGSDPGFQASIDVYPESAVAIATVINAWGIRPPTPVENAIHVVLARCMGW
jgi:CubicO group peptidase (beta-lactamase class C family)